MDGWIRQIRGSYRNVADLERRLVLRDDEREGIRAVERRGFPLLVTPYYLSLIDPQDPNDPIRIQCVPTIRELDESPLDLEDPLAEEAHTVAPELIRRYPDRALLLTSDRCATHCRHCTRRRRVGSGGARTLQELESAMVWLENEPQISEVLISGGDPLVARDPWIDAMLTRIRQIRHIEVIRVGSRVPVTLPQRITDELCEILRIHSPIIVSTHFNHERELTDEAVEACSKLADAGIPLANQAVLLKGVNDTVEAQESLGRALLRARVRPYYLMQCDSIRGTGHLRVPVRRGLEIMKELRWRLTGLAIPRYVLDLPGGQGKVELATSPIARREGDELVLTSPKGVEVRYFDPRG